MTIQPFRSCAPDEAPFAVLADAARTAGRLGVVVSTVPPGLVVEPHCHHREDESFVLLSGTCTVTVGDEELVATPGSLVFAPRGIPHALRVGDDGPARMLTIVTPGGLESFFATLAGRPDLDPQALLSLAADYGVDLRPR
jgi:quercetin dioxygenase-like cupin family protein